MCSVSLSIILRIRDRFRKTFLRVKSVLTESKYKQQRNKVNNLKKQANQKCYANINDNLDELKSANGKLYLPCWNAYTSYFQKY
jgi:hypothetical protein